MTTPRPGDVVLIGWECSVQFAGDRALTLRVVSIDPRPTYDGWVWLAGYVLNKRGEATDKREVFVMKAGLRVAPASTIGPPGRQNRARSRAPAQQAAVREGGRLSGPAARRGRPPWR